MPEAQTADPYPEHTRLAAVSEESEAIGRFLDESQYVLAEWREIDGFSDPPPARARPAQHLADPRRLVRDRPRRDRAREAPHAGRDARDEREPGAQRVTTEQAEEFHFMRWGFDITAIRAVLGRSPEELERISIPVDAAARLLESDPATTPVAERQVPVISVDIRWDHVDRLPEQALEAPLFAAPLGEIGTLVIDGWHRIALARRLGVETLPALLLSHEQASRALLPGSAALPPEPEGD